MKNSFFLIVLFLCAIMTFAQNSGRGFSYQAVARGGDGQVKPSTNIEIRFSLLPNGAAITPDWQETQVATTDEFGVFALTIGKGIKSAGSFAKFGDINFGIAEYWIKVELKDNGTWQEINKTQLLSVPYAEVAGNAQAAPVGSIMPFAGAADKLPQGWLFCDGSVKSRTEYAALYAVIGTAWGYGDNSTTFNIPDLRGLFLRGVDGSRGQDPGRDSRTAMNIGGNTNNNVGSYQDNMYSSHNHTGILTGGTIPAPPSEVSRGMSNQIEGSGSDRVSYSWKQEPYERGVSINANGGNETRPKNANVFYIIKY
jgi:microcystin-dependent protein